MFCFKCGNSLPDRSKACNFCGESFLAKGLNFQPDSSAGTPSIEKVVGEIIPIPGPEESPPSSPHEPRRLNIPKGTVLANRFRIEMPLARGDYGEVFLANDLTENQRVALKVIPFEQSSVKAFFEEVRGELSARDIVADFSYVLKINGYFTVPDFQGHFLLMISLELAVQGTFRTWLTSNRNHLEFRQKCGLDFFVQACDGLRAIHSKGLVHLDLNPDNLYLCGTPHSCTLKVGGYEISPNSKLRIVNQATQFSFQKPGFTYLSPDHFLAARQEEIPASSDIYSMGLILFEILDPYGKPPFDGSPSDLRYKHIETKPPKIKGIDDRLAGIVRSCLEKKPTDRYENADALYAALQRYFGGVIGKKKIPLFRNEVSSTSRYSKALPKRVSSPNGEMEKFITNSIGMKLRLIGPGSVNVGSIKDPKQTGPIHKVTITKPFYMGMFLVAQEQYEKVMGVNPSHFKSPTYPLENVNWDEAKEFCRRLTASEVHRYRLPRESEWEYACRAGTSTEYFWGEEFDEEYCWCSVNSGHETHEVGTKKSNPWELFDMCGNVWEWCEDWHGSYPDKDVLDPKGPESGSSKVVRGGSWCDNPTDCTCASRGRSDPNLLLNVFGFRVVAKPK